MADERRIAELIFKQLRHRLSVEEKEELEAWLNESDANREWMETRMSPDRILSGVRAILEKNEASIRRKSDKLCPEAAQEAPVVRGSIRRWGMVAAAFAGVLIMGGVQLFRHRQVQQSHRPMEFVADKLKNMEGVTDRAKLTLRNGDTIFLDKVPRGNSFTADGWKVSRIDSHRIIYAEKVAMDEKGPGLDYHTFSTPYGQSWQVSLPDHSQIELSTGSSLTYPVTEAGTAANIRNLVLQGEARFEVNAETGAPFVVFTHKASVTALSTIFDVRDYPGKDGFLASVMKGSINVSDGKTNVKVGTGEAASVDWSLAGIKKVEGFDTIRGSAWRTDFFDFTGLNVRESMEDLKRWYGMDSIVIHQGVDTVRQGLLSAGTVKKASKLENLLPMLEKDHLHLTIEGKTIVARP